MAGNIWVAHGNIMVAERGCLSWFPRAKMSRTEKNQRRRDFVAAREELAAAIDSGLLGQSEAENGLQSLNDVYSEYTEASDRYMAYLQYWKRVEEPAKLLRENNQMYELYTETYQECRDYILVLQNVGAQDANEQLLADATVY